MMTVFLIMLAIGLIFIGTLSIYIGFIIIFRLKKDPHSENSSNFKDCMSGSMPLERTLHNASTACGVVIRRKNSEGKRVISFQGRPSNEAILRAFGE